VGKSKATVKPQWKLEGGGLGARTNFVYEGPELIGLFYKNRHADRCIQAFNSYNPARDKLARELAEAVIRTVPGPSKKGDPVSILLKLARKLLALCSPKGSSRASE